MCRIAVWLALTTVLVSLSSAERSAIHERSRSEPRDTLSDNNRGRRRSESHDGKKRDARKDYSSEELVGYRFGEEYFKTASAGEMAEASEPDVANARGAGSNKVDGCERVTKDSMICMVCKDPRTNSNYEQCSYVARPKDRIQTYASSRSFGGPNEKPEADEEKSEASSYDRYEEEPPETRSYGGYRKNRQEEDKGADRTPEYNEPQNYETSYTDREIASTAQTLSPYRKHHRDYESEAASDELRDLRGDYRHEGTNDRGDDDRLGESTHLSLSDRQTPESRHLSDKRESSEDDDTSKRGHCREIQKDSMTCTVCTNPKNGGNFEKCSYTHQPNDRLYKYSKSKSFGYPETSESSPQESKRVTDVAEPPRKKKSLCRKYRKNSTTLCNVCEDKKNGETYEECEYNLNRKP